MDTIRMALECCVYPDSEKVNCERCRYSCAKAEWVKIDRKLAIDILARLKAQEPRVMTLEEVKANRLEPIWLETQDNSYFEWALWRAYDDEDMMRFFWGDDGESWRINVPPEEYGKTWRCWTSRPSDERLKAVKWG